MSRESESAPGRDGVVKSESGEFHVWTESRQDLYIDEIHLQWLRYTEEAVEFEVDDNGDGICHSNRLTFILDCCLMGLESEHQGISYAVHWGPRGHIVIAVERLMLEHDNIIPSAEAPSEEPPSLEEIKQEVIARF